MAELNQLDNATHRFIRANGELADFTFQKDPLIAYARVNNREDYDGGRLIAENFNMWSSPVVTQVNINLF